jgi:Leucine-rich repeat (LRR) protein
LDISRNGFVGTLSSMIERLTKLETLRGAYNDLSGEIPSSIGNLLMLQEVSLEENNFFGVLPPSLEDLASLKSISLQAHTRTSAGLSGPPLSFAKSPQLRNIDLGSNSLTGTIPDDLLLAAASSPNDRITVQFDSNFLTGWVPTDLALRFSRLDIDLTGNRIEGIPDGLCDQIPQWMNGDVGRYSCRGLLCPAGEFNAFGRQTSEETRCEACPDSDDSYLGSTICPSILKAQARQILERLFRDTGGSNWKRKDGWLNQNENICDWYGITCRDDVAVESIILGSNNLGGTPPKELFEIFGLKTLWLYSNPIDFSFTGIEKATTLKSLQLDATGLKSLNGIGNCPSLVDVDVRFNQLSGPLSNEIASLSNLETFFCGDNGLSGPLPSFETNRKLTTLRVGGNAFSGQLPSFDVHPNLKTLDVSNNQLSGEIPSTFLSAADSSKPIFIDISSNLISGTIPGTLSRLSEVTLYARDNRIQGIHPDLCLQDSWNGGDVGLFGCDAILCPPSSYSPLGRTSDNGSTCLPCKKTVYFGRSECSKLRGSSAWSSYLLSRYVVGFATLGLWVVL